MTISDMCPECNRHMKWINMRKPNQGKVKCPLCRAKFTVVYEENIQ